MAPSTTFFCLAGLLALSLLATWSSAHPASVPGPGLANMGRKLMQSDEYCPAGSSGPWKCPTCNMAGYSTVFCCKPGYGTPRCLCPSGPRCFPLRSRSTPAPDVNYDSESTPAPTPRSRFLRPTPTPTPYVNSDAADEPQESFVSSYISAAAPDTALPSAAAQAPAAP